MIISGRLESNLTPEDVYWGALLGIAEMIEAGVTSVADHYFAMDQVARAVCESGMRANLVWAVFGHEGQKNSNKPLALLKRGRGNATSASQPGSDRTPHIPPVLTSCDCRPGAQPNWGLGFIYTYPKQPTRSA
jgi:cytosine/adenosine deaminase-related metal-dependent hydrolase